MRNKKEFYLGAAIFVASIAAAFVEYHLLGKTFNLIHMWGVVLSIMGIATGGVGMLDNIGHGDDRKEDER